MKKLIIPCDIKTQAYWFKLAGIKMPKDQWLRKVALFGIAYCATVLKWNDRKTIEKWWHSQIRVMRIIDRKKKQKQLKPNGR